MNSYLYLMTIVTNLGTIDTEWRIASGGSHGVTTVIH